MLVSKYSYNDLCNTIIGKIVTFESDCHFFPNFKITGKVLSIKIASNNEYLINVMVNNGKRYDIGSHMHNLSFKINY